jgi:tetrahydromethanopterin S-methyltransferase subunit G
MEEVTREEFSQLQARVSVVEREVEGEKLVTRYILEQSRRNGDDLAAVKTRLDRVEQKLDGLDSRMLSLEREFRNFPTIVGEVVREAFRERDEDRRR